MAVATGAGVVGAAGVSDGSGGAIGSSLISGRGEVRGVGVAAGMVDSTGAVRASVGGNGDGELVGLAGTGAGVTRGAAAGGMTAELPGPEANWGGDVPSGIEPVFALLGTLNCR